MDDGVYGACVRAGPAVDAYGRVDVQLLGGAEVIVPRARANALNGADSDARSVGATRSAGRTLDASQVAGIPGTDGPLTAELVYVGYGTAPEYDGRDVRGKLVLVDWHEESYFYMPGLEAQHRGAVGVVLTKQINPDIVADPDRLGTTDGRWRLDGIPL
ncbi:hypothetical protein JOD63_000333 [Microbacterium terrae]|uniref:PA domain-containing protein n=1 Tax=Microbacterium terrae TaxID=69369 RepID=A0A0M2GV19_9MICO|nr:PA domain-containing protein [Microbacterium terrae]KJL37536.1 hypothetical protein RS81_03293 [Microbacterium terrae]MBP1076365.1 hypothetical protein [Microbacterium terrae]